MPAGDDRSSRGRSRALEWRRSGQLTPAERKLIKRNRLWLIGVAAPSLAIGAGALVAALELSSQAPPVKPLRVPAGYQAINDGYFAYSVPSAWSTSQLYSDDDGDLDTSGPSGWAAENVAPVATTPPANATPPSTFEDFGEPKATPYTISPAVPTSVTGASVAYRYVVTRPGGFTATAVNAYQYKSGADIWLLIYAPPAITTEILSTLRA
jgi:hypothetical protein